MPEQESPRPYLCIPFDIWTHPDLQPSDKLVFGVLLFRLGSHDSCWPSHETLARDAGISKRSLRYSLDRLKAQKLIETHRDKPGRHQCLHYSIKRQILPLKENKEANIATIQTNKEANIAAIMPIKRQKLPTEVRTYPKEKNKEVRTCTELPNIESKDNGDDGDIGTRIHGLWRRLKLPIPPFYSELLIIASGKLNKLTESYTEDQICQAIHNLAAYPKLRTMYGCAGPDALLGKTSNNRFWMDIALHFTDYGQPTPPLPLVRDRVLATAGLVGQELHDDPERRRHEIHQAGDRWKKDGRWFDPDLAKPYTLDDAYLNQPDTYPARYRADLDAKLERARKRTI